MRHVISGSFELDTPAVEAIGMFTPEGERTWVAGWSPVYTSEPSESPGTVFTTTHAGGVDTIWLIWEVDRVGCTAAYARVTPGHHAGTVRVVCTDAAHGICVVTVTYDMTVLPGGDPNGLASYAETPFEAMLIHWAESVSAALENPKV